MNRIALALICLASAMAAQVQTDRPAPRLLPLPKSEDSWHFVIYGDRTGGPAAGIRVLEQAVADTNILDPDLVLTVGDLVQGYNDRRAWLEQMREYRSTVSALRMPWFPVAGNHDIYWRGAEQPTEQHEGDYEKHFGPLWYWFKHKNAAFVALFSDERDAATGFRDYRLPEGQKMSPEQKTWLARALRDMRGLDHVFVFLHHPRWIENRYPDSDWDEVHALLKDAGNVTAVFAGHIHQMRYDGRRDGIEYFALATTGGSFSEEFPQAGFLHHLDVVTVRPDGIVVATLPIGAVIDPKEVTGRRAEDLDRLLDLRSPPVDGAVELAADEARRGVLLYTLANPTGAAIEVEATIAGGDASFSISPDHHHLTLGPDGIAAFKFDWGRTVQGADDPFTLPRLHLRIDYLAEGARIAVPERRFDLPVAVPDTAPVSTGGDRVLDLGQNGAAARVDMGKAVLADGPFTIEGRVRARKLAGRRPFLAKTEQSEFGIFLDDGKPKLLVHLGGAYVVAAATETLLATDRWHHVAGVYDGRELRLYVDGRLAATQPGSGRRKVNALPLFIGADPDSRGRAVDSLDGAIDEVRLSRVARYQGGAFEPAARFASDRDTVLLFHFDHGIGPFLPNAAAAELPARRVGRARVL